MKKLFFVFMCLYLSMSLSSCGVSTADSNFVDEEALATISKSSELLKSVDTPYLIVTDLTAPDGRTQYLECVTKDSSYTEYSVDTDGSLGTLSYGSSETMSYILTDWLCSDNTYYMFNDGGSLSLGSNYGTLVGHREDMYVGYMLDSFESLEFFDNVTLDLGRGAELITCYRGTLGSEKVSKILGVSSKGIYDSLLESVNQDTNIGRLCKYYVDDLGMRLTFSDADVIIGIDKDGILKYVSLVTGGLGSKLYCTKYVVSTDNTKNLRTQPDFSNSIEYVDTLEELANYCAGYESVEEAMLSLEMEADEE